MRRMAMRRMAMRRMARKVEPMSDFAAVILAAGEGTRMKSPIAKVLHTVAGRPMIHYPVRAAIEAGAKRVVVVIGHSADDVRAFLTRAFGVSVRMVVQAERRGTGHAALVAMPEVGRAVGVTLILCGDTPLVLPGDLAALVAALCKDRRSPLALLSCMIGDPTGYGRIVRDAQGKVIEVREQRDLRSDDERATREINAGVYAARTAFLEKALAELKPDNLQKELYLTDIVRAAGTLGGVIARSADSCTLAGVNDGTQLACAEAAMHRRIAHRLGECGVMLHGSSRIDDTVEVASGACIGPGVVLSGATVVSEDAVIDVGSVITDSFIGKGAHLLPYSVVTSASVEAGTKIGPFAHVVGAK
jgi:bifunctional UDP-N-acetylglucosamine pyrophosphorylase / glucosamine-1-phosphate N-acetyltransferase